MGMPTPARAGFKVFRQGKHVVTRSGRIKVAQIDLIL